MAPRIDLPGPLGDIDVPVGWARPCKATHWNEGVRVEAVPSILRPDLTSVRFHDAPYGVVADGSGGAFLLSVASEFPFAQGALTIRHVAASGAVGARIEVEAALAALGVINLSDEAALVAAPKGRCLVAANCLGHGLEAAAFDAAGGAVWRGTGKGWRKLRSGTPPPHVSHALHLCGEPDGTGGAFFAWRETGAGGLMHVRVQRVAPDGTMRFGSAPPVVAPIVGAAWPPDQPWAQLVATGKGGAVVVAPVSTGNGFRYDATTVSPAGVVGGASTIVASTSDDWRARHRLRIAVPDNLGGLFLAYGGAAGSLRLLRYTPGTGVRWDVAIATPYDSRACHVREDGRGGVLVAWVGSPGTSLNLRRYDAQGSIGLDIATVVAAAPIDIAMPPLFRQVADRDTMARVTSVVPDGDGGAIAVWQERTHVLGLGGFAWPAHLRMACFDATGALVGAIARVTARPTDQALPLLASTGAHRAVVAWADDGNAAAEGSDLWAQGIGCCPPPGDLPPPPPFGCEILSLPTASPDAFAFRLPCGNDDRGFGVIPLSRFAAGLRGVDLPGALQTHDAPAPAWIRLVLFGLPATMDAMLVTLAGKRVGEARRLAGMPGDARAPHALTFALPARGRDLLLVFSREGAHARDEVLRVRVAGSWGEGRPPALPRSAARTPPPKTARTKRRSANR